MKASLSLIETPLEELEKTHEFNETTGLWRRKGNQTKQWYTKRVGMRLEYDIEVCGYSPAEVNTHLLTMMKEEIPDLEDAISKALYAVKNVKVSRMKVVK